MTRETARQIRVARQALRRSMCGLGFVRGASQLAARPFMQAFRAWSAETACYSFVAFVQYLDPTVPTVREEYLEHPTYQAADYMRRLAKKG